MSVLDDSIAKLDGYLARFRKGGILNRIGGRDVARAGVFQTILPVDESVICDVAPGEAADIDAAAGAAHEAFAAWRDMPALKRKAILIRIAEGIEARAEGIALCECWDTGQAYKFMSKAALRGAKNVRHLPTPFGGVKASGIGRDGGDWSFEFYMEQKHVGFALG